MSQENVEIVLRANEAFNRGDVESVLTFCAEDIEVEDLMNAPDVPSVVHDIQGVRQLLTAWVEAYENREQALEAVGLSEQDAHADS